MTIYIDGDYRREIREGRVDRGIAALAACQHGVVARRQLLEAGLPVHEIDYRVKIRRLHVLHRGVYAVGHRVLTPDARLMAAVLACGDTAVLSHRTAARRWGIRDSSGSLIDVTVGRHNRPRRRGVRAHCAALPADEVTVVAGVPVTSMARTIVDVTPLLSVERLTVVLAKAERQRLDWAELRTLVERHRVPKLRTILDAQDFADKITLSDLEDAFLEFLAGRGLPRPEVNAWVQIHGAWIQPDCLWRKQRVIAELDSWKHHGDRRAFYRDRSRSRGLTADGWATLHVTDKDLKDGARALEADLRKLLLP